MVDMNIIILITTPSSEIARAVADILLERRLAACVNIIAPVDSLYIWNGARQEDREWLLIVKSRSELFGDQLISAVKSVHPYEVPEIIALPILMGSDDYLAWINDVTTP